MKRYRLLLTARALADLRGIRDYIAKHSPLNAAKFLNRLLKELDVLEITPDAFAAAPEDDLVPYTLRQVIVKPYRVLYRVNGSAVEILHIRHGARLRAERQDLP